MKKSVIKFGLGGGNNSRGVVNGILVSPYVKVLCCYLALFMTGLVSSPKAAMASFISHRSELVNDLDSESLKILRTALENELIAEKFSELGLTQEEIIRRIEELNPEEREVVLEKLDTIQRGGNDLEGLVDMLVIVVYAVIFILCLGYLGIKAVADASKDKDKNDKQDSEKEIDLQKGQDTGN